jgi:type VI protein secretion system component VasK
VRYQWIYGAEPPAEKPRREELAQLYEREYVRRWQDYLASGSVARFASPADAAVKLGMLGAPTSPLFGMLATASRETAMDSTTASARPSSRCTVRAATADARGVTACAGLRERAPLSSNMNLPSTPRAPSPPGADGLAVAADEAEWRLAARR